MGFLIGVMKGATIGGAVPAILFNTPGTPDAFMTTLDGHPMARKGQAGKALRVAHFSSAAGDTFSDVVLILCAPFLAILVERYLDLPEKTALLILSLAFIASVIGRSVGKGLISMGLGLLAAYIGTGEDFYPRLSFGTQPLAQGFPIATAVLGVLIIGEVFKSIEDLWQEKRKSGTLEANQASGDQRPALGRHQASAAFHQPVGRYRHRHRRSSRHRIDARCDARLQCGPAPACKASSRRGPAIR